MRNSMMAAILVGTAGLAGAARADENILFLDFEDGEASGWTANGIATIFDSDGNPGRYMGVPLADFFGVTLSAREDASRVYGDLRRYVVGGGSLRISVDVRVFALVDFAGEPIDPTNYPLVLQFWNYDIPSDGIVSVYTIGPSLPPVEAGWTRVTFDIPDPTGLALPAGWGGTGAEDPVTFEPELPAGVTYADVLGAFGAGVGQVDITTFVPGFFYGFNFWQVGWDNLSIDVIRGGGCAADFNGDGFVDFFDYGDYVACFEGAGCGGGSADFNRDGFVDFFDYTDFVGAFEAGC
ncbi:MAG: hypothetical protein HEQ23_08230 [Tepidisphaera sp.]